MAPSELAPDCVVPVALDVDGVAVLSLVAGGETVGVGAIAFDGMVEDWSEFDGEGGFAWAKAAPDPAIDRAATAIKRRFIWFLREPDETQTRPYPLGSWQRLSRPVSAPLPARAPKPGGRRRPRGSADKTLRW